MRSPGGTCVQPGFTCSGSAPAHGSGRPPSPTPSLFRRWRGSTYARQRLGPAAGDLPRRRHLGLKLRSDGPVVHAQPVEAGCGTVGPTLRHRPPDVAPDVPALPAGHVEAHPPHRPSRVGHLPGRRLRADAEPWAVPRAPARSASPRSSGAAPASVRACGVVRQANVSANPCGVARVVGFAGPPILSF